MVEAQTIPGVVPVYEDYTRCVHCGLCLNHCPTYRLWQLEADSPRGRIRQMILVNEGQLPVAGNFVDHIDKCLDCRSCETACPSGVEYGKLVEHARAKIAREYRRPWFARLARSYTFKQLLSNPKRIATFAGLLRFYQKSGIQKLARAIGILRAMGLADKEKLLPKIDDEFFFSQLGKTFPASGARRARVALFAGCIANVTFSRLNHATIRVLVANGCEVVIPEQQFCCGALAAHAGERGAARELARKNLRAFGRGGFDAILTNAAGCGSTLKEYAHLFDANEPERPAAKAFGNLVKDVTEFLATLGVSATLKAIPARVTYQDSCHLLHGQKIREAPRQLLRAIPGVDLVELPFSDICCGSAGIYNVTQTDASMELLAEKMKFATATQATIIATANPGCLLQLRAGSEIHKTGHEVLHVIELLDRALYPSRSPIK
ncbi:MAG TPA: heterodisulfide reductase-related iron-sulfur binding cluster [Dongiaceae bacterium]|nr:heterodisulfide reductase-related iron-sulfur binding cluster [Dongiaceae bacterium]